MHSIEHLSEDIYLHYIYTHLNISTIQRYLKNIHVAISTGLGLLIPGETEVIYKTMFLTYTRVYTSKTSFFRYRTSVEKLRGVALIKPISNLTCN